MQNSNQIIKNRLRLNTSIDTTRFLSLQASAIEVMMKVLNRGTKVIFLR